MSLRDSRDRRWRAYASLAAAVLGMSWSAVLTLLVVCLSTGVPLAGYSGRTWASLFALGLISQFAAYFAFVYALGHLPATLTSVANLAQIPLVALLAVPLLGEPVSRAQVAGGMLVLTGIYVVSKPPRLNP